MRVTTTTTEARPRRPKPAPVIVVGALIVAEIDRVTYTVAQLRALVALADAARAWRAAIAEPCGVVDAEAALLTALARVEGCDGG